jgi:hypothetical protein
MANWTVLGPNGLGPATTLAVGEEHTVTSVSGEQPMLLPQFRAAESSTRFQTTAPFGEEAPTIAANFGEGPTLNIGGAESTLPWNGSEQPTQIWARAEDTSLAVAIAEGPPTFAAVAGEGPTNLRGEGPTAVARFAENPSFVEGAAEVPPTRTTGEEYFERAQGEPNPGGTRGSPFSPDQFGPAPGANPVAGGPFGSYANAAQPGGDLSAALGTLHTRFVATLSATRGPRSTYIRNIELLRHLQAFTAAEAVALTLLLAEADDGNANLAQLLNDPAIAILTQPNASQLARIILQFVQSAAAATPSFPVRGPEGEGAPRGRGGAVRGTWKDVAAGCLEGAIGGAIAGERLGVYGGLVGAVLGCAAGAGVAVAGAWGDGAFSGGAGCFDGSTLVLMAEGRPRKISELHVGDRVLAIDERHHDFEQPRTTPSTIEVVYRHNRPSEMLSVGGVLATALHPWAVRVQGQSKFLRTAELDAKSEIRSFEGCDPVWRATPAMSVHPLVVDEIFNLRTSARTFAVGHTEDGPFYLVHNKSMADPFQGISPPEWK